MNGIHDLGGMDGFGPVEGPPAEPPFHEEWEGRVLALSRVMTACGEWNIDVGRYWIEKLPPDVYLTSSYYKKWFLRLENLCLAKGLVSAAELAAGAQIDPARPLKGQKATEDRLPLLLKRAPFGRAATSAAQFALGDKVQTRNIHPKSHTRLPRFARGKTGVVERIHGCHVYPDAYVADGIERGEWLYTVTFDGRELWGPDADPTVQVSIEAFEPYLERRA